jgi:MFS family permease
VPLKERGKYQGFISAACSLGNAIGPFVGGGLASAGQWRWVFRIVAISGVIVSFAIHLIVPLKPVQGSAAAKLKMINYTGVLLASSATIFLLIPISGGGSTLACYSPTTIALLVSGVVCLAGFVVAEAKIAKLPILPCKSPFLLSLLLFASPNSNSASFQDVDTKCSHGSIILDRNGVLRDKSALQE